jgi:hypothetical protein
MRSVVYAGIGMDHRQVAALLRTRICDVYKLSALYTAMLIGVSFDKILCLHMKPLGRHARFYHARTVHKQKKFQSLPEPDLDRFDVGNLESAYIFHSWMVREFCRQGDDYMCFHALLNFSGGDLCA